MAMKVTQRQMNGSYLRNLNNSQYATNKAMEKIETGRAFTKISEDVSSGTRAINIRSKLYKNEQLQENVQIAGEKLEMASDSLMQINDCISSVQSEALRALNMNNNETSKEAFKAVFSNAKDEIFKLANTKYNDVYVLGGTNISEEPFSQNADGELMFNGVKVSDISFDSNQYMCNGEKVKYSEDTYIDIGLDVKTVNGKIDPHTAYKTSASGLKCLGYGKTTIKAEDSAGGEVTYEVSNNICDIINDMYKAIEDGDMTKLGALNDHLGKRADSLSDNMAEIGVRSKFLETTLSRLENENMVITNARKETEEIDDATEITNYMNYQNAWNLTLRFGSSIIPKSLMDYVN